MAAPTLMTIPKEIRLNILKFAAEDVWPKLTVHDRFNASDSSLFGFCEVLAWTDLSNEPYTIPARESGLPYTCHILREEFLEVLGATHPLHLDNYEDWLDTRLSTKKWRKSRGPIGPSISSVIPASYAALVQKVRLTLEREYRLPWKSVARGIIDAFPSLKQLHVEHIESYTFSDKLGDLLWTVQELEEHARGADFQATILRVFERARTELTIESKKNIILTVQIELGRFYAYPRDIELDTIYGSTMVSSESLCYSF